MDAEWKARLGEIYGERLKTALLAFSHLAEQLVGDGSFAFLVQHSIANLPLVMGIALTGMLTRPMLMLLTELDGLV